MKKTLLVLLLLTALNAKPHVASDKFQHAFAGALIYAGCIVFGKATDNDTINQTTCLLPVIAAGVGKELYDKKHPDKHTAEFADIAATMAIPLGTFVIYKW